MKIKDFFYSELDTVTKDEIEQSWWLERFRNWRQGELLKSDYTQLPDSPHDKEKWATYRQELRDLTKIADFGNANLPDKPE